MFTVLAGAMITVSATALGVYFKFSMPELTDTLPTGVGWVVAVLATGVLLFARGRLRLSLRLPLRQHRRAVDGAWCSSRFGIIGLRQMGAEIGGAISGTWPAR